MTDTTADRVRLAAAALRQLPVDQRDAALARVKAEHGARFAAGVLERLEDDDDVDPPYGG